MTSKKNIKVTKSRVETTLIWKIQCIKYIYTYIYSDEQKHYDTLANKKNHGLAASLLTAASFVE